MAVKDPSTKQIIQPGHPNYAAALQANHEALAARNKDIKAAALSPEALAASFLSSPEVRQAVRDALWKVGVRLRITEDELTEAVTAVIRPELVP